MSKAIPFKKFVLLQRGFDLPNSKRKDGTIPIVASTGISGYHSEYKVDAPGVVTGRSGSLGMVQYITENFWPLNTSLWVKDFKGNLPRYVYYYLQTMKLEQYNSGAGVPTLNRNDLDAVAVTVHDYTEQERVVDILSAYDSLIENNNRRIAILEEMGQKLYREWFVHFRFPEHKNVNMVESQIGMIPEGWKVSTIYDEAYVLGGGTPSKVNPEFWQGGSIPLFSPRDATGQIYVESTGMNITELGLKKCNSRLYPRNTIIITARGTVGKIVLTAKNMAINQSCYALQSKEISQFYLLHMLRSAVDELKKVATGTAFDAIVTETFKNIKCLVPAKSVCLDFEHHLENIYYEILVLQKKNTNLRKTRDLLLPRLISGDIDVSELDIPTKEG